MIFTQTYEQTERPFRKRERERYQKEFENLHFLRKNKFCFSRSLDLILIRGDPGFVSSYWPLDFFYFLEASYNSLPYSIVRNMKIPDTIVKEI